MSIIRITTLTALFILWATLPSQPARAQADPGPSIATHHETIPNPVYDSEFRVAAICQTVEQPCYWDDPTTWQMQKVPDLHTLVIVDGYVQIRNQDAEAQSIGIYSGGKLTFASDATTRLQTADLMVFEGGILQIGTMDAPIGTVHRAEIIFRDLPFDDTDSSQHLRGLLVIDGVVRIFGHALNEVFLRTAVEPKLGDVEITLTQSAQDAGWRVGDSVVIPTSRQCATASGPCSDETEDRTIAAISADGFTITLNEALKFDHPGARNHAGLLDFSPHLINKSRNVILRSENSNGVRGHLLLHGRADVDMRYGAIHSLGRTDIRNLGPTNQKGRYPLHAHHLIGPETAQANGYQFTLIGNVVDFGEENREQGRKWGISIHGSHYGLIERNVVDHASGAAIVTESGSEIGNMFRKNFVVRVIGGNGERTQDADPIDGSKLGRAGTGYWFNGGGGNSYKKNVVAAVAECIYCYGFKFDNIYNGELLFPNVQGADPYRDGGETISADAIGINNFTHNEAYAVPNGLTVWWACTYGDFPTDNCSSRLDSFKLWHHHRWGYHGYPANNMTLANFVIRGDPSVLSNRYEPVNGMDFGDYFHRNLLIQNADIQNVRTAIDLASHRDERGVTGPDVGINIVEDSYLVSAKGVNVWAPASVNGASDLPPQTTILRNVRFDYPAVDLSGQEQAHIIMQDTSVVLDASKMNQTLRNDLWIYNYNRAPGEDGEDLYIVPSYHGPNRCDNSIGVCGSETTPNFDHIHKGHVYPLRKNDSSSTSQYFSSSTGGNTGTVRFADEDILLFDPDSKIWAIYFDGSDVGLRNRDVDAFHILDDGNILLSLDRPRTIGGVKYDDSDIIKFTATSLGKRTRGSFSMYLDGSDVQLTTNAEDIDAIARLANGDLVISTLGTAKVKGVTARDEDMLRFHKTRLGNRTQGTWSLYLDGSDVKLSHKNEDVWAVWIDEGSGQVQLSTYKNYSAGGLTGDSDDIIACDGSMGSRTSCKISLEWDGDDYGFGSELIDGYSVGPPPAFTVLSAALDDENAEDESLALDDESEDILDDDEYTERIYLPVISR